MYLDDNRFYVYNYRTAEWWNGRRGGLKILCLHGRVGSSPTSATKVFPKGDKIGVDKCGNVVYDVKHTRITATSFEL